MSVPLPNTAVLLHVRAQARSRCIATREMASTKKAFLLVGVCVGWQSLASRRMAGRPSCMPVEGGTRCV